MPITPAASPQPPHPPEPPVALPVRPSAPTVHPGRPLVATPSVPSTSPTTTYRDQQRTRRQRHTTRHTTPQELASSAGQRMRPLTPSLWPTFDDADLPAGTGEAGETCLPAGGGISLLSPTSPTSPTSPNPLGAAAPMPPTRWRHAQGVSTPERTDPRPSTALATTRNERWRPLRPSTTAAKCDPPSDAQSSGWEIADSRGIPDAPDARDHQRGKQAVSVADGSTGFSWRQTPLTLALADANSFYASCEEVFRPALVGQPVIVLSNNDGCVIARSRTAKRLPGVAMGAPVHTIQRQIREYGIIVCSANFALYGDLSRRMLDVMSQYAAAIEPYSIDEAMLDVAPVPDAEKAAWAQRLVRAVQQAVGVRVSVGVAPTKTLCKIATDQAKEDPSGVCVLLDRRAQEEALARTPIEEVWGIGARRAAYLRAHGIETAYEFAYATDPAWVKRHLYVPVARTQWELRGVACLPLETTPAQRQQMLCAKSFGRPVRELTELKEALADYTARVAAKAQAQGSLGATTVLWLATNGFRQQEPQYSASVTIHLPRATAFVPDLLRSLYPALERLYRPGFDYHRVGVLLCDLTPETPQQAQLFTPPPDARDEEIMTVMTRINERFGRDTIRFLATGTTRPWQMQQTARSPRYTTRWSELAKAQ